MLALFALNILRHPFVGTADPYDEDELALLRQLDRLRAPGDRLSGREGSRQAPRHADASARRSDA
jgi:hypothetical protein